MKARPVKTYVLYESQEVFRKAVGMGVPWFKKGERFSMCPVCGINSPTQVKQGKKQGCCQRCWAVWVYGNDFTHHIYVGWLKKQVGLSRTDQTDFQEMSERAKKLPLPA